VCSKLEQYFKRLIIRLKEKTHSPTTKLSEEHVTIVQLHGSTASPSQLSRTPCGSSRERFMLIKACTALKRDLFQNSAYYEAMNKGKEGAKFQVCIPSKFTPLGESKASAELQKKNNVKNKRVVPLGFPIQIENLQERRCKYTSLEVEVSKLQPRKM